MSYIKKKFFFFLISVVWLFPFELVEYYYHRESAAGSSLQCNTCKKTYSGVGTHFDMTAASGSKDYGELMSPATEFFRYCVFLLSFTLCNCCVSA